MRILIVDDEEAVRTAVRRALVLAGYDVEMAANGDEALALLAERAPDAILLDVLMPGIKGLEVLERVKRTNPLVQVLLLTGHGSTRDGIEGMRLGAYDYMMKPLNIDTLIEKMESATDYAMKAAAQSGKNEGL